MALKAALNHAVGRMMMARLEGRPHPSIYPGHSPSKQDRPTHPDCSSTCVKLTESSNCRSSLHFPSTDLTVASSHQTSLIMSTSGRLWRFPKPEWLNSTSTRTAGVYLAGALVRPVHVVEEVHLFVPHR